MMKRRMFIEVQGKSASYCFHFKGDPALLREWRSDGLNVYMIQHFVPRWVASIGLLRPWCALQTFWQLLRFW